LLTPYLNKAIEKSNLHQLEGKYTFQVETTNQSLSFGYTDTPFLVRQNIDLINSRYKRCPFIDLSESSIHFINIGRYMILIRIGKTLMQMFFLDYHLNYELIKSIEIFTPKEIEVLLQMRDKMFESYDEADDVAIITSIYN
jgi:hypothetical protein